MRILLAAIYPYAFLLLYLIIPFDNYIRALPNILLAILVIAFPFIVKKSDFQKLKSFPVLVFLVLFAYLIINALLTGRFEDDINVISKVLLAAGLVILYIPIDDFKKIQNAIIFSALAAMLFSIYNFVLITDATGNFQLGDSSQVIESLLIDRLYLGLLCVLSILISATSIKRTFSPYNNYHFANILATFIFILLIASKIALIALILMLFLKLFFRYDKEGIIVSMGGMLLIGFLMYFFLNPTNADSEQKTISSNYFENSMTREIRSVAWDCSIDVANKVGFTLNGIGFDAFKNELVSCYDSEITEEQNRANFVSQRYNSHNQFFDFYLGAGFIALFLFITFIILNFISIRKNYFQIAIWSLLILYCMLENIFHRQIGAYYVGFILIIMTANSALIENNSGKKSE